MSKARSCLRQQLEPGDEVRPDAEIRVGLRLDQPPDGAQDLVLAELVELRLDRRAALQRQRRDHAGQPRIGARQLRDPCGLVEMLGKIDVDLDEHELLDLDRPGGRGQIARQHQAVERRRVLRPGVAEAARIAADARGCRRSENQAPEPPNFIWRCHAM